RRLPAAGTRVLSDRLDRLGVSLQPRCTLPPRREGGGVEVVGRHPVKAFPERGVAGAHLEQKRPRLRAPGSNEQEDQAGECSHGFLHGEGTSRTAAFAPWGLPPTRATRSYVPGCGARCPSARDS